MQTCIVSEDGEEDGGHKVQDDQVTQHALPLDGDESLQVRSDALPERVAPPEMAAGKIVLDLHAERLLMLNELFAPFVSPKAKCWNRFFGVLFSFLFLLLSSSLLFSSFFSW